jgi:hypothetical protein
MKKLNKIFTYWRDDLFGSKAVPDYRREKNLAKLYNQEKNLLRQKKEVSDYKKEYPYNIEFGDGRTKEEMDKMQDELMQALKEGC